jgi:hypothetical protein
MRAGTVLVEDLKHNDSTISTLDLVKEAALLSLVFASGWSYALTLESQKPSPWTMSL